MKYAVLNGKIVVSRGFDEALDELRRAGMIKVMADATQPYGCKVVGSAELTEQGRAEYGDEVTLVVCNMRPWRARLLQAIRRAGANGVSPDVIFDHSCSRHDREQLKKLGLIAYDAKTKRWKACAHPSTALRAAP